MSVASAPPVMLPIGNGASEHSESVLAPMPPLQYRNSYMNAVPITFAPPSLHLPPAKTKSIAPGAPMWYSPSSSNIQKMQVNQTSSPFMDPGTNLVETRRRSNDNTTLTVGFKRQAMQDLAGSSSSRDQVSTHYLVIHLC